MIKNINLFRSAVKHFFKDLFYCHLKLLDLFQRHLVEFSQPLANFITHPAKDCQPKFVIADVGGRRVFKTLVNANRVAGKYGAAFLGVVADGNNVIEMLPDEFVN